MATAIECFKCEKNPGNVPLSCNKHSVCRSCLVALIRSDPTDEKIAAEQVFKCPAKECRDADEISKSVGLKSATGRGTQYVSKDRSYKDVLTTKSPISSTVVKPEKGVQLSSPNETERLPGIWIFVHQSNMWIEAKKLYSRMKGFVTDQDHRVRIDMGKLADVLGGGREELTGKLYGSEPPPIDSVWKRIRERGWEVITSQRSQLTGKEKQVDTKLVADVISLACKTPEHERTTIILVTGDANIIPAIEGVLNEERWKVEVYMWENAISNQLKQLGRGDRCKVFSLDQYLEQVTFTNMKFHFSNPNVRSMVCAFGVVFRMEEEAFKPNRVPTDDWIDSLDSLAQWPSQYYWFDHKRSLKNDLVVVFRPVSGKRFNVGNFLESVKIPEVDGRTKYRLKHVQGVQTFIQFITALIREARQDPELKKFDAALEQVGLYTHDDVCAGYENDALYVSDNIERWQIFRKKHRPQSRQRYTQECPKHYNCFYGTRCHYGHSPEEVAYFKKRKDGRGNPQRKVTLCRAFENKRCFKKKEECDWAHGDEDAWCKECRKTGHLGSKCPHLLPPEVSWADILKT